MASVQEHYETHLAPIYTWMHGGASAPRERFAGQLAQLGLHPSRPGATALDLGAGSGFQALPLAAAGYDVTAVDLDQTLLAELARDASAESLTIKTVTGDIRDVRQLSPNPAPEVIVCMGDTLTHLASRDEVARLLADASAILTARGHLLLSFRDYSIARNGTDRFIPVRSDHERIFTCFLEFSSETHVVVHDIVHTSTDSGWQMKAGSFQKIRLSPAWVVDQLIAAGLRIDQHTTANGFVTLVAHRPSLS